MKVKSFDRIFVYFKDLQCFSEKQEQEIAHHQLKAIYSEVFFEYLKQNCNNLVIGLPCKTTRYLLIEANGCQEQIQEMTNDF